MSEQERKWLETVPIGGELAVHGPLGLTKFGCGWGDLERAGYIRVERDYYGLKITRLH